MNQIPAEVDAIIVGGGASGLAAALTLAEGGASVAVFEKQPNIGGTSVNFRGTFAVESDMQRERYITYSRDQSFRNIMEYSHWRANPRLVRAIVNQSASTIPWLQEKGVIFREVTTNMPDTPQTYHVINNSGRDVVAALAARLKALGAPIFTDTPVTKIIMENGRVAGATVTVEGQYVTVKAGVAVIASGGYANNKDWIKKYAGLELGVDVTPIGNVGKTGDGIRMAFEAGAAADGLGMLELLRTMDHRDAALGPHIGYTVVQPGLWVNLRGERFCDEGITYYDTTMGNASVRQPGNCTYSLFDNATLRYWMEDGIDKAMEPDLKPGTRLTELEQELSSAVAGGSHDVLRANSLEELAEKAGIDPVGLATTVEEYKGFCSQGRDELFAKNPKYLRTVAEPPFYAVKARTTFLGTLGGIKINQRAEAVNKNEEPVPGLYAGGMDAGGMYGDSYCINDSTGLSSGFALNSGRLAGKNALKYLGK